MSHLPKRGLKTSLPPPSQDSQLWEWLLLPQSTSQLCQPPGFMAPVGDASQTQGRFETLAHRFRVKLISCLQSASLLPGLCFHRTQGGSCVWTDMEYSMHGGVRWKNELPKRVLDATNSLEWRKNIRLSHVKVPTWGHFWPINTNKFQC